MIQEGWSRKGIQIIVLKKNKMIVVEVKSINPFYIWNIVHWRWVENRWTGHMEHNREWFAMLDDDKKWGQKVALSYMVKGQGIVLIKMPNGDIK